MSTGPDAAVLRGPVGVVTAVAGRAESAVAAALSGRRDLVLVRRCADVAELLSVTEAGLAAVAVVGEGFPGLDADVVDRVRLNGCTVLGVVDPDRESSERLRTWGVAVVPVDPDRDGPSDAVPAPGAAVLPPTLAQAVLAAVAGRADSDTPGQPDADGSTPPGPAAPAGPPGRPEGGGRSTGRRALGRRDRGGPPSGADDATPAPRPGTSPVVPTAAVGGYSSPAPGTPGTAPASGRSPTGAPGARDGDGAADRTVDRTVGRTADPTAGGGAAAGAAPDALVPEGPLRPEGRLVAVWGPAGAPGRTTVAVSVAAELAASGDEVLLVDADTYAASVAQVLGLLDESPGLVAAVRAGLEGRLEPTTLARLAPTVSPRLRVLTGLSRAARWSELRPAGLQAVWTTGRRMADHVVVDLAPPLEEDDELSYDTAAPRRNAAAVEVLRAADDVLVVGSADPVGLQRLVRGLQDLAVAAPGVRPTVVVNRVRADAVGRNPRVRVREALERFAGVVDPCLVPDDRSALDRALLAGRTLVEQAPGSPAREAMRSLAAGLARAPHAPASGRARRRQATGG